MRRRLFNLAAAVSLVLFLATAVMWVRSYMGSVLDVKGAGQFFAISKDGVLSLFHLIPGGVTQIDFHYWRCAVLLAVCPALWLLFWIIRPRSVAGRCRVCRYDLTGNTSGICPECGTPVAGKAEAKT